MSGTKTLRKKRLHNGFHPRNSGGGNHAGVCLCGVCCIGRRVVRVSGGDVTETAPVLDTEKNAPEPPATPAISDDDAFVWR